MSPQKDLPVIFLMGPTATGKTGLAMALHELLPVDLINVDASQVYRGMDIGTAKPSADELARAPHRLIDIRDPSEPYSAAEFCADARKAIWQIHQNGRIPLLVGGTMFYFHALEYGLSRLPAANKIVRDRLLQQAGEVGWAAMHVRLAAADPESAERIHPNDSQRVQRALEILELTGQPPSVMGQEQPAMALPHKVIKIALMPEDREELKKRIATRFQHMLDAGLVDEVKALLENGNLANRLPAMRMVGYRQVRQYLDEEIPYNQMVEKGINASRQLAKRQLTWLRRYENVFFFNATNPVLVTECLGYLQGKLSPFSVY
ncbi:MAG: tRNA (adenosine(37)-N6)-dimethylallyltransferase MiaA [Acidiferrobacterales bacterium]